MIPPLQPQTLEEMRARFPKALEVVFQYGPNADTPAPVEPNLDNVFDFSDGMRLCVTRDGYGERVERQFSAAILRGTPLWFEVRNRDMFGPVSKAMFQLLVEDRYRAISGDDAQFRFCGFSKSANVPHWRRPE